MNTPSLLATATTPSPAFWSARHVGVRIDAGIFGARETVIVLTGAVDDVPSRLLADRLAHATGGRMIEAPALGARLGALPAIAYDHGGIVDALPVAVILVSRSTAAAQGVARALIADAACAGAIIEADRHDRLRQAPGALLIDEEKRLGRPLAHCMAG